jgi:ribonucleotide reductase alpha subunit
MMGATQPFLSGAISKTVNMPEEATIEDIEELHMLSWELGVKAVAVYRDNCKVGQPLSTMKKDGEQGSSTGGDASGAATQIIERIVELFTNLFARNFRVHVVVEHSNSEWPIAKALQPSANTPMVALVKCS